MSVFRSLYLRVRTISSNPRWPGFGANPGMLTETEDIPLIAPTETIEIHEMRHIVSVIERTVQRLQNEGWNSWIEIEPGPEYVPIRLNETLFFEMLDLFESVVHEWDQFQRRVENNGELEGPTLRAEFECIRKVRQAVDQQIGESEGHRRETELQESSPQSPAAPASEPPSEDPLPSF